MIADYIGNYKLVLHISLFFTGLFYTLLLMVDAKGLPRNMTNTTMATFQCSQNTTELIWSKCENSCDLSTELNLTLLMETCHSECPTDTMTSDNTKFLSNSSRIEFVLLKQYDQNGTCRGVIVPKFSLLEELQCTCFKKCQEVLDGFDCPESTRMSIGNIEIFGSYSSVSTFGACREMIKINKRCRIYSSFDDFICYLL